MHLKLHAASGVQQKQLLKYQISSRDRRPIAGNAMDDNKKIGNF